MKRYCIVIIALLNFMPDRAFAQTELHSSRFQIHVSNLFVPNGVQPFNSKPFIRNVGFLIGQNIGNRFSINFTANKWYSRNSLIGFGVKEIDGYTEDIGGFESWDKGDILRRFRYSFLETSVGYELPIFRTHALYAQLGVSYTFGYNEVILSAYQYPGAIDWLIKTEVVKANYLGGVAQIGYNYLFFKSRINVGFSETLRLYPSMPLQWYLNLNLGYNFSLLKTRKNR